MTQLLKISQLSTNKGQIEGLPKNPRFIRDNDFERLKKSIQDDPEMLELREVLVYPHGNKFVIIGGNMRYRAAKELGFKELPCKIIAEGTPVEKLRAYTIKDNNSFGEYNFDDLANEWELEELEDWGVKLPSLEIEDEIEEEKEEQIKEPTLSVSHPDFNTLAPLFDELKDRGFEVEMKA